jgi:hypothetical protein
MADKPIKHEVSVNVPADVEAGVPADFAAIWHTHHTFVLDFAALKAAPEAFESEDARTLRQEAVVVARVRIPPAQVFEMMKALEQQLTAWEKETGQRPANPPPSP